MEKATTEFEIKISSGRITNVNAILENGICKLTIETVAQNEPVAAVVAQEKTAVENPQDAFVFVEASKLSIDDEFMKYEPKTEREEKFKKELTEAIKKGVKDFWRPRYDPSFNKDGTRICYVKGKKPAVGKSYNWWKRTAEAFCPEWQSHLGTKSEYVAFLGVLIKTLVENGWKVEEAWSAVCNDSRELGHYWNSQNAKHAFEDTGSREICGFFDLANTYKILTEDEEARGFWLAGGNYNGGSNNYPLADLWHDCIQDFSHGYGVGWLVLY
jgi:hypothetical protein